MTCPLCRDTGTIRDRDEFGNSIFVDYCYCVTKTKRQMWAEADKLFAESHARAQIRADAQIDNYQTKTKEG